MEIMLKKLIQKREGFTLIEILVVIGIIAVLATIVIIAINPARQFAQARDTQRTSNLNTILNAIGQNIADNRGIFTCSGSEFTLPGSATVIQANTIRRTPYRWLPAVALLSQRLKPSLRIRICLSPAKHSSQCFPQKPPLGGFCLSALSRLLHQPHLLVEDRSDLLQGSYGKAMHPGFHPSDHRLRHVGFRRHLFLGHSLFSSEAFKVESNVDTGYFLKIGFLESRFFALFFDEDRKRNESEAPYYFFTFFLHSRLYIFSSRSIMRTGVFWLCFLNISTT